MQTGGASFKDLVLMWGLRLVCDAPGVVLPLLVLACGANRDGFGLGQDHSQTLYLICRVPAVNQSALGYMRKYFFRPSSESSFPFVVFRDRNNLFNMHDQTRFNVRIDLRVMNHPEYSPQMFGKGYRIYSSFNLFRTT